MLMSMKQPVPIVTLQSPTSKQHSPNSAACWSATMDRIGMAAPKNRGSVLPKSPLVGLTYSRVKPPQAPFRSTDSQAATAIGALQFIHPRASYLWKNARRKADDRKQLLIPPELERVVQPRRTRVRIIRGVNLTACGLPCGLV